MLIITNRNVNMSQVNDNGIGDENTFGDELNESRQSEVQLATVERYNFNKWKVKLIEKPDLCKEYLKLRKKLVTEKKNCVFFIHGYDQTFKKNLDKIYEIEKIHGVEVIAFSWPSNVFEGKSIGEYRAVLIKALASVGALSATLIELGLCNKGAFSTKTFGNDEFNFKFSLMAFSLGNFLFRNYINNFCNDGAEKILFDNIVLCQADVDNDKHEQWVDCIKLGKRVYVTINENDYALDVSEKIVGNPERLGATVKNLNSNAAKYIDFTHGQDVLYTHSLFKWKINEHVRTIFTELLNGRSGELVKALEYKSELNAYQFIEDFHHQPNER